MRTPAQIYKLIVVWSELLLIALFVMTAWTVIFYGNLDHEFFISRHNGRIGWVTNSSVEMHGLARENGKCGIGDLPDGKFRAPNEHSPMTYIVHARDRAKVLYVRTEADAIGLCASCRLDHTIRVLVPVRDRDTIHPDIWSISEITGGFVDRVGIMYENRINNQSDQARKAIPDPTADMKLRRRARLSCLSRYSWLSASLFFWSGCGSIFTV